MLLEEASYARADESFDVPMIRSGSFLLASAMAAAGFADEPGVKGWIDTAKSDPLPEVRNAQIRERRPSQF
jgi:hypothetical protein